MTEDELNAEAARRFRGIVEGCVPDNLKRLQNGGVYDQRGDDGEIVVSSEWLDFVKTSLTWILVRQRDEWRALKGG